MAVAAASMQQEGSMPAQGDQTAENVQEDNTAAVADPLQVQRHMHKIPSELLRRRSARMECLHTAVAVGFFAIAGCALRVIIFGLTKNLKYGIGSSTAPEGSRQEACSRSASAAGYFVQNMLGCMLIAMIARHKTRMHSVMSVGLSAGLCGSLTTFGTWMQESAVVFLNGDIWMALIEVVCQLAVCQWSFNFGHYVAGFGMIATMQGEAANGRVPVASKTRLMANLSPQREGSTARYGEHGCGNGQPVPNTDQEEVSSQLAEVMSYDLELDDMSAWADIRTTSAAEMTKEERQCLKSDHVLGRAVYLAEICSVVLALGVIATCLLWFTSPGDADNRDTHLFDLALAPLGALLRWTLSWWNPALTPVGSTRENYDRVFPWRRLPVFTLIANVLGAAAVGVSTMWAGRCNDDTLRALAVAVGTGFGGSLSTVSTFVSELSSCRLGGLRLRFFYALISFGLAMAVLLPLNAFATC
eukprot:TRINITY_DN121040_c0_g1_i1.p1 TRINITY_DN121040_c0_g1~~TRINITY_DN121040_c0_g1_i1.p1  ORF type:complete len:472 (+),score=54.53 TRINITY_DN121040_c0_g1_i1:78-1493(+)